jgi:hypothetical protein
MKEPESQIEVPQENAELDKAAVELRRRQSQDMGLEIIRRFFAEQAANSQV